MHIGLYTLFQSFEAYIRNAHTRRAVSLKTKFTVNIGYGPAAGSYYLHGSSYNGFLMGIQDYTAHFYHLCDGCHGKTQEHHREHDGFWPQFLIVSHSKCF